MSNKTIKRINKVLLILMAILMLLSVFSAGMTASADSMPKPSVETGTYTKKMCESGGYTSKYSSGLDGGEHATGYKNLDSLNQDIMKQTWDGLIERGFSEIHTAGIMGNITYESAYDPGAVEGNGVGLGLVQWSYGRRTALESFAKEKGKKVADVGVQLDFLVHEFETSHKAAFDKIKSTDNVQDATYMFLAHFEIPSKYYAHSACRFAVAPEIYEKFSGSKAGPSSDEKDGEETETGDINGRGEYTGNLEYDPFEDGGVVNKSTGINDGNSGTINSQETYVVSQWIDIIVSIILIVLMVILAAYMVFVAIIILLVSFTNSYVSDNKVVRALVGGKFLDKMVGNGVKSVFWEMMLRFLIGSVVLIVAITGMVNGLQYILIEAIKNAFMAIGL